MNLLKYPISTIIQNYELLRQLTVREIELRHKGSWLGKIWIIAHPLLLLSVYTLVFSVIYDGSYGVIESETPSQYALGIFLGITFLHLFNDSLGGAVTAITGNPNYVKKVVFPLETLPISLVFTNIYNFSASLILCILGISILTDGPSITILWLPLIVVPSIIFAIGVACAVSAIGVFYRDINPVIQVITLCMLWLSGVFYSARSVPENFWHFIKYNPVLLTIEMARDVCLWDLSPNPVWLAYSYGISIVTFYIGFWIFKSLRSAFADVI